MRQARPRADQGGGGDIPPFGEIMDLALRGDCRWFMNHEEIRAVVHDLGMEVYSHSAAHQACFTSDKPGGTLGDGKHWSHKALCAPDAVPTPTGTVRGCSTFAPAISSTTQLRARILRYALHGGVPPADVLPLGTCVGFVVRLFATNSGYCELTEMQPRAAMHETA